MLKKRFPTSTIKEIQFESLIKSPLAPFMMASAVAYNDIKLFHFLKSVVASQYASCDGANAHSGEYAGLMWQTIKFVLALIHEYLELVREFEDEFESDPFKKIISAMPKHAQESWEIVHSAALGSTEGGGSPKIL